MNSLIQRAVLTPIFLIMLVGCSEANTASDIIAMSEDKQSQIIGEISKDLSAEVSDKAASCVTNLVSNPNFAKASINLFSKNPTNTPRNLLDQIFRHKCVAYKQDRVMQKLDVYEEALALAEHDAQKRYRELIENAERLPDGRPIFQDADGEWFFENGDAVPQELVDQKK